MATAPYTTAEIREWSPSDWQAKLPALLAFYNAEIGEGVVTLPSVDDTTERDALDVPAGSLVYVLDGDGAGNPGVFVYDGSAWQTVWQDGAGGSPPGGYVAQVFVIDTAAASSTTAVHAAYGGDQAEAFPGPFTNPDVPRVISVTFGGSWDGGDVEVTGTDQYDNPLIVTFNSAPGSTQTSLEVFKTVTAATHSVVGVDPDTASIGTGDSLGITVAGRTENDAGNFDTSQGIASPGARGTIITSFSLDAGNGSVLPSNVPNGTIYYVTLNVTTI